MKLGLTYNLKSDAKPKPGEPDDRYEEFDSLETIEAIEASLRRLGHQTVRLGWGLPMLEGIRHAQQENSPIDGVFNLAEGVGGRGRESQVPATLEMMGIPFTGSDALTLALSLDKALAKRVASSHGIPTPPFRVIEKRDEIGPGPLRFPLFAKPAQEGSSMGITPQSLCNDVTELHQSAENLLTRYGPVLIEEFLPGREFTVGVIGNDHERRIVGTMEVVPRQSEKSFIYSLEMKRDFRNRIDYLIPPPVPPELLQEIEGLAVEVVRVFGCRDVTRVDIRCDRDGSPNFIEMNPLPGINPSSSDLIILARGNGWTYDSVIAAILEAAVGRWKGEEHWTRTPGS